MKTANGLERRSRPLRVSSVSYLNTVPLVRGLLHQQPPHDFDLHFCVPSLVADRLESGEADIGIVPCGELDRLDLDFLPETGIACTGPVRSILLISRVPPSQIKVLAADSGSRTSVLLARIILNERYGSDPLILTRPPELEPMLAAADAALIIGDPALRLQPENLPWPVLDLGDEWSRMTGLPMVFAVWAGARSVLTNDVREAFLTSCRYGLGQIEQIALEAPDTHGIPTDLARLYLTRHIQFLLGPDHLRGLELYRSKIAALQPALARSS